MTERESAPISGFLVICQIDQRTSAIVCVAGARLLLSRQ
jgi:hypothetical protein